MANLNDHLNSILTVLRVEEMKTAIINAVRECYYLGTAKGNAGLEVGMAKGEFDTLAERLDYIEGKNRI